MREHTMHRRSMRALATLLLLSAAPAAAEFDVVWPNQYTVSITGVTIVADGVNNQIAVTGVFTPALPCATQGFFLLSSDAHFKESYSMLLTAKATGSAMKYSHIYCHSNGYSRGHHFMLQ